jgi:uncharacterized protein YehS (DUF1456 family)
MTNNDVLRRVRYTFELSDSKMISIFEQANYTVTREQVSCWLKKDEDSDYKDLPDFELATFLNGFINDRRGKKEGASPVIEKSLTNNMILMKLKIALNLKAEDMIELMKLADFPITKPVLSAFFRRPGHNQYRECQDQILRYFLNGMQLKYHSEKKDDD